MVLRVKGYRLWDTESRKAIPSRSVVFDESVMSTHALIQSSLTSSVIFSSFLR
jgi:hypothetical protein